jgi:hypothetical protein
LSDDLQQKTTAKPATAATAPARRQGKHTLKITDQPVRRNTRITTATFAIAIDTEFFGPHTLSVQVAIRKDPDTIAVQLYRSAVVPELPQGFDIGTYLPLTEERYGRFCKAIELRPVLPLTPDLSPVRMWHDLLGLEGLTALSRLEGERYIASFDDPAAGFIPPVGVVRHKRRSGWKVPEITIVFVGHFLTADLGRVFGRDFLAGLKALKQARGRGIVFRHQKRLFLAEERAGGHSRSAPVVEYLRCGSLFHAIRLQTRDTLLPFGPASLERHSQTFLGLGKCNLLTTEDKRDMLRTFQEKTADAYGYALVDPVNTLLIHEQMVQRDCEIYRCFNIPDGEIPPLRPTLGSRVSTFLVRTARQDTAAGSSFLSSESALQRLMRQGGASLFENDASASRFGKQTAGVHGGLLYSRSPTRFWHEAPGMLRDVDMSGCYQRIIADIHVYLGRPVILEPGDRTMSLKEAVDLARGCADDDAWQIRVGGPITAAPNALIPSTDGALTAVNYRQRTRKGKRQQACWRAFQREAQQDRGSFQGTRASRLYSACIESGVVTWATWLMVQALPEALRKEYEELTAESIILYPRDLAAADAAQYDDLVQRHRSETLPWRETLDLPGMRLVREELLDADYVTLKYPIWRYAQLVGEFRSQAQQQGGKGSGMDLAWKLHANTMYGVLASPHLPTNNFVAANLVTARARAEAFALGQALNGIQTITDGCTYRLDQVPACTFAECLRIKPDYPIRRAEEGDGIPFQDPKTIPQGDDFTPWYREHVQRFLGVSGSDYDALFGTHALEHKQTGKTGSVVFDALACDGAGNYMKCTIGPEGRWQVQEFKARSYRDESKELLGPWMVETYSQDRLTELAPVTEDSQLLSLKQAAQKARKVLASGVPEVYFPLGLEDTRVLSYKALKASAFVFRTPKQRGAVLKQMQKFEKKHGVGLEVLALRRSYAGRKQGSLCGIAEDIYTMIREGKNNLTKVLNLNKLSKEVGQVKQKRLAEIDKRKREAEERLAQAIDARNLDRAALPTAHIVTANDVHIAELTAGG